MEFINYTSYDKAEDIKRLKFISNNLPSNNGESLNILEIGCGNGNISYQLARNGHHVTGIDICQTTINTANEKFGDTLGLQFKVVNAELLTSGENEKYDVIVCSEVLEHLHHPDKLVSNFKNLLNKDGLALVTVPNGFGPREIFITKPIIKVNTSNGVVSKVINKIKLLLGYKGDTQQTSAEYLDHIQFFTIKKLEKLADTGGFVISKKGSGNFIETVFPFSLLTRRLFFLQQLDCFIADLLPISFCSIFYSVWNQKDK